ncbi:MAG TPA: hypothetical protein VKU41_10315 [Polyangiaceae bacterium]|nr:hypothetical protein [Polyangiaceae bacterium]
METKTRWIGSGLACALAVGVAAGVAGCPSSSTATGYTPITGIEILSSSLVAGYGCGEGPGQVYRYAAIVSYAADAGGAGALQVANVFDCFVDGVFENLPASDSGSQSFAIAVQAYNRASFPASLNCPAAGGPCNAQDPGKIQAAAAQATWTTTCTATQQQGIPVLAVCGPLVPQASAEAGAPSDTGATEAGAPSDAMVDRSTAEDALVDGFAVADATVDGLAVADATIDSPTE